jgi:hypothetical protein
LTCHKISPDRGQNTLKRCAEISQDESGFDAHDAIARAPKRAIPARIRTRHTSVIPTVNLDDEP